MSVEVKIEGLESVQEKLKQLQNPRLIKNAARRAARKAMATVRKAARENAKRIDDPETAEKIWKNIAISAGKTRDSTVVMRVGVRGGAAMNKRSDRERLAKLSGGNTTYWRHLEFGNSNMPPTPFMRPALQSNIQVVTDTFSQQFNAELDKELNKL